MRGVRGAPRAKLRIIRHVFAPKTVFLPHTCGLPSAAAQTEETVVEKFEVNILGCGSALPTLRHNPSAQVVNVREKLFMVDCGEGTQLQLRRMRLSFSRLRAVFISHLHGDHCFGLMGLISTLSLLGRTAPLDVYGPASLEAYLQPQLDFFARGITFPVSVHACDVRRPTTLFEDRSVRITAFPLYHRIACCGFRFDEQPGLPHIRRDMIDFYHIPYYAINAIKQGSGWQTPEGDFVAHERLVTPAAPPRSYAYCSDTAYNERVADAVRGVDLLYHEATFAEADAARAAQVMHSTARQAAQLARRAGARKLLIGHFSSRYDDEEQLLSEARAVFPNTVSAHEGLCLPVGTP